MNNDWITFLESAGANHDASGFLHFSAEWQSLADTVSLIDLSYLTVIDISGDDATSFLQAQFCNDLAQVTDSAAQLSGYCSPKGRLLAIFTVFSHKDGFRLILPRSVAAAFEKRLKMYVLRAKVTITRRVDLVCCGIMADYQSEIGPLDTLLPVLPLDVLGVIAPVDDEPDFSLLRWHDAHLSDGGEQQTASSDKPASGRKRYLRICATSAAELFWTQAQAVDYAGDAVWRLADISAGIPTIGGHTQDEFVPQMVNLQLLNGLSFKKGCYPGQEIVARMQYLGKLKRQMRRYQASGSVVPAAGSTLVTQTNADAGKVIDAVAGPMGIELLAVIRMSSAGEELFLHELLDAVNTPPVDNQAEERLPQGRLPQERLPLLTRGLPYELTAEDSAESNKDAASKASG